MESPFHIEARDSASKARAAVLQTAHGPVGTPVFMPVGTQATVKALTPVQVRECGAQILLGNTYHLQLRPGPDLIHTFGGLQRFMAWDGPILTDSGGFQVFSLAKLRRLTEEGIHFQSHLDGQKFFLGPRECIAIQDKLGSDIAMALDECPPWPCDRDAAEAANVRTIRWARECLIAAAEHGFAETNRILFPIGQGSAYADLRQDCAAALSELNAPGYAIGGVSVGEPEEEMLKAVAVSTEVFPVEKPRYVMGVGTPPQLLQMVALGADMFDCVMPTRLARHGTAFTPHGTINLKNNRFASDASPLVEGMDNYTCRHFSRAYLRHLIMANELLGSTLLSLHNVHFFVSLMDEARAHIQAGDFTDWSRQWIAAYDAGQAP